MYVLFRHFKWTPMQYYSMSDGEQRVVKAFISRWADDMEDLEKRIKANE